MDSVADVITQVGFARDLILGGIAVIGAIVGALSWIDRRIDSRIAPLIANIDRVLSEVKNVRHHQREIARHIGLDEYEED